VTGVEVAAHSEENVGIGGPNCWSCTHLIFFAIPSPIVEIPVLDALIVEDADVEANSWLKLNGKVGTDGVVEDVKSGESIDEVAACDTTVVVLWIEV
jgi:hypothetical protein